jgi:REP element-mobilizing transposase RayT
MLLVLEDAKTKFGFRLANFCIMPTHIHLLIIPGEGGNLSQIMHWIKTHSAKRWNRIHGSTDHLWGERYFARPVKDPREYVYVMEYIDQNPVKAGLVEAVGEWKASGAYYIGHNLSGLVDYTGMTRLSYVGLLPAPVPATVSGNCS